ncbi:probable thimet oligopeptidase [Andrographis paniculata]|uniref:probable thimet oligopeptidase n=1 Tax=Andrographis paniculata TaxID=175694 RepID=UPI0021E7BB2E|nr:probable thimet oligopeptidase [Andrographis paniculata]
MESEGKKRETRNRIALTGAAAVATVAVTCAIAALSAHIRNRRRKVPSGSSVRINMSSSEILRLADHIIAKSKEVHDKVAAVPLDKVSYANTILPLAELEAHQFPLLQSCAFPKLVSVSEDIRKASMEAERRIDAHFSACSKREDVYRVIKAFAARGDGLSSEVKRFAQYLVQDFERNGMSLTSSKREELERLRAQIDELSMRYIRNLNDDSKFLLLRDEELLGLPTEFLKSLEKADNAKFKILLRSHQISPILELCKVGSTRKSVAMAYGKRCEVNLSVLEKLVQLRHKLARLLGYMNYADYAIDHRMANSSAKVFEFLEKISGSLTDLASKELSLLMEMKRKEGGEIQFGSEDMPYYVKRIKEQQLDLDFGLLKHYFPINLVLSGIFKICQDLFGLRFDEILDAEVWHQDVKLFSVFDLGTCELMGHFYLDLYTREGKYGHTCVVALQNGSWINNIRQIPVALLISQLQKEVDGSPGLLRFSEVVNLFHEFGHVVQHICNRARFARFSGLRLDSDFVEIPSLLLENWCYESDSLKLISGFYQDITKPIDDEMCRSLKRWRFSFSALKLKQEILYCLFDQIIHSTENVDMVGLFKHLHSKVMLGLPMLDGLNPASCFPNAAIGFEATCYSRLWSEVFAVDLFATKFRDDIFNQNTGMHFRNKVLAAGAAKDPLEILSDFLGREPSIQAFLESRAHSI